MISWRERAKGRLQNLPSLHCSKPAAESSIRFEKQPATLVFVDGFFSPVQSSAPPEVVCQPLDVALKSYSLFFHNRWSRVLQHEEDPLYLHNMIHHGRGLFLYVPPNVHTSLHIVYCTTGSDLASPKTEIMLGESSSLALIETIHGGRANRVLEMTLDAHAKVKGSSIALLPEEAEVYMTTRAVLKQGARCELFHATDGAKKARYAARVELLEEQSSFYFRTLAMLRVRRQAEIVSQADHIAPYTISRQHVKTVLNGQAQTHFEGKIHVRPTAQKIEGYQLSNHLLLSENARASSRPNLEIFADDVKASHGATFSQIADEDVFYLRSRGLSLTEAKALLLQGFCRELIDDLESDALKTLLLDTMAKTYA